MKVAIITHSSTFNERVEAVARFFEKNGHTAVRVFADFDHRTKKTLTEPEKISDETHIYLHLKPYTSNLSVTRLLNIRRFALDVGTYLEKESFDLLYFLLPANTFVPVGTKLKARTGAKLIFDVIDLWPESLPLKKLLWLPPVRYWAKLRDREIGEADVIFTECAMYQKRLELPREKTYTLYWCKEDSGTDSGTEEKASISEINRTMLPSMEVSESRKENDASICESRKENSSSICESRKENGSSICESHKGAADIQKRRDLYETGLRLVYLGAINNIIDIPRITAVLQILQTQCPVHLDIIGDGEHRTEFVDALLEAGIDVTYHGVIFDDTEKSRILQNCHAGINIMKPGVQAGLSMKSIEYLANGLPLVNNLKGDLWEFTERERIGVNVPDELSDELAAVFSAKSASETLAKDGRGEKDVKDVKDVKYVKDEAGGRNASVHVAPDSMAGLPETAWALRTISILQDSEISSRARAVFEENFTAEAFEDALRRGLEKSGIKLQ